MATTKYKAPPHITDLALAFSDEFEALMGDGRTGVQVLAHLWVGHARRESERITASDKGPNPISSIKFLETLKIPIKLIRDTTELTQRVENPLLSTDEELEREVAALMTKVNPHLLEQSVTDVTPDMLNVSQPAGIGTAAGAGEGTDSPEE